jgi:hypothetical protein
MGWKDILALLVLVLIAGIILYRAIRKKKWCPAVYGSAKNAAGDEKQRSDSGS